MLRSCYRTDCRFFASDPDHLSRITWYFARANAKLLGYESRISSIIWDPNQKYPSDVGEVLGATRPWYNGADPTNFQGRRTCSPASFFMGLSSPVADPPGFDAEECCTVESLVAPMKVGLIPSTFAPIFTMELLPMKLGMIEQVFRPIFQDVLLSGKVGMEETVFPPLVRRVDLPMKVGGSDTAQTVVVDCSDDPLSIKLRWTLHCSCDYIEGLTGVMDYSPGSLPDPFWIDNHITGPPGEAGNEYTLKCLVSADRWALYLATGGLWTITNGEPPDIVESSPFRLVFSGETLATMYCAGGLPVTMEIVEEF